MKIETIVGKIDSNTFVVQKGDTTIVIDAGATLSDLQKTLGKRRPSAILLTHEHYDHVFYLDDYKKAVYDGFLDTNVDTFGINWASRYFLGHKKEFACEIITPSTEDEIVIGDFKIQPILCPGHSPQSVVYLIDENLFTGDVLFSNTIGRTDLMPDGAKIMQTTLRKLLDVKFETAYHGHYEPSTYDEQQKNIRRFLR